METRQQTHTTQFYEWELRGRGVLLFEEPVELECEYHPFFMHRAAQSYQDDGIRPTILSSLASAFKKQKPTPVIPAPELPPIAAIPGTPADMRSLAIAIPRGSTVKPERMEQLFISLAQITSLVSFEIIATHQRITIQLACPEEDFDLLRTTIAAYIPEATLTDGIRLMIFYAPTYTLDFGLNEEFMRPLAYPSGNQDWYVDLFILLDRLTEGEQVMLQVLYAATVNAWSESIMRSVTINGKESFFEDAPEMPSLAKDKTAHPLVAATVRLFVQAKTMHRAEQVIDRLTDTLIAASASPANALTPLGNPEYDLEMRVNDILNRQSHRLGMLLNIRELATLAHLPSAAVRSAKLLFHAAVTKPPPTQSGSYQLGINEHQGTQAPIYLSNEKRLEHIHIIGATGTGKSTLLHSLICQDIYAGNGCAVLDPHGDLVEHILAYIPKHRVHDVLLIDPSDAQYPISFNLLHAHTDLEKQLLASDLVSLFRRFSTSWGDQMNSVFANAILAFLESSTGGTLSDLRRFLIEKPFREQFLKTVQDEAIAYYWQHEYPLLKSSSLGSILTRLDTFLRPKLIRNMVSQRASLNMEVLMNERKIVLVKLSQGLIGEENAYLLGACIVSKLQQAAMARQATKDRIPFYCYIDEFHHFITPSMSSILTGARKYGLGLIVAHQDMQQVSKQDSEVASSIIANAGTRICFRLGETDAKKFAEGFSAFTAEDIQNLNRGEAIVRIGRAQDDCNMRVLPTPYDPSNLQDDIIAASRQTYAVFQESVQKVDTPTTSPTPVTPPPEPPPIATTPIPVPPLQEERTKQQLVERIELKQHRYWQEMIRKLAQERGYKADIELPVLDGTGQVDVSLERDGTKIAIEISVSTTATWELHNIKKCLAAGYDRVIAASADTRKLHAVREQVQSQCDEYERGKISVTELDRIADHIPVQKNEAIQNEQVIKGYRVKVSYTNPL